MIFFRTSIAVGLIQIWTAGLRATNDKAAGLLYALLFSMGIFVCMILSWFLAKPYAKPGENESNGETTTDRTGVKGATDSALYTDIPPSDSHGHILKTITL